MQPFRGSHTPRERDTRSSFSTPYGDVAVLCDETHGRRLAIRRERLARGRQGGKGEGSGQESDAADCPWDHVRRSARQ